MSSYTAFTILDTEKCSIPAAIGYKIVISPKSRQMHCWDLIVLLSIDPQEIVGDKKPDYSNAENILCVREICDELTDEGDVYSIYPLSAEDKNANDDGTAIICVTGNSEVGWIKAPKHLMH